MAKSNRFKKRQEIRRVYFSSLQNDEVAYLDGESGQVEVVKMKGRDRRFQTPYLTKSPTFAELNKLIPGSAEERSYLNARVRDGLPRYNDVKTRTQLG